MVSVLRSGILLALKMLLKTKEDGLIFGGPPCGSWIFINSATHQRRKTPERIWGDTTRRYVQQANKLLGFNGAVLSVFVSNQDRCNQEKIDRSTSRM